MTTIYECIAALRVMLSKVEKPENWDVVQGMATHRQDYVILSCFIINLFLHIIDVLHIEIYGHRQGGEGKGGQRPAQHAQCRQLPLEGEEIREH